MQQGQPQSREKLAALLWEEADGESARTSLRQALSAIRRSLPARAHSLLRADTLQVALDAAEIEVDVMQLRALLLESTPASLRAALTLSTGELLEGFDAHSGAFDEWLGMERRTLRRDQSSAMQMLARLSREAGDAAGEIDALNRLLALEPLNEPAHRELMEACARAGRYTDALRQYQQCRALLRRELDLAPEPATEALYRELMKKRRAAAGAELEPLPGEDDAASDATGSTPAPVSSSADDATVRTGVVLALRLPGFDAQRRALDPEELRELAQRCQQAFDECVTAQGGVADRLSGDRLNAVFGLDAISGNEPQRALRAAEALQQAFAGSDPAIGVAQGALLPTRVHGPFPLSGEPMLEAEALAASAAPGETLLSGDLRRGAMPHATPFVGRHAELGLMVSLLERTIVSGRGRTIVVRGEAGIGKTRLLDALAEAAAARGVGCHRVQVLDFGQVKARRPLAALFASLLGLRADASSDDRGRAVQQAIANGRLPADSILHASGLAGAPLSPGQASIERNVDAQALERGRLDAMRRMIEAACAEAPILLVIEDLHYAGGEEAARLGELAASVATQRALLVVSVRPDEDPIDAAWRARARGCPLTTLDLAPLSDDEALEIAAAHPGLSGDVVADCIRRAQGHPLFLDQLLRAADAGERSLPGSVQALVLARMDRLPARDRQLLLAASVLGLRFPREALAALADGAAPEALVDAGMLAVEGGEVAFTHALLREAVYASILKSTRRELHARAGAWYAGRDAGLRAGHLAEAADPAAPRACIDAATAEAEAFRLDRALEFAGRASALARDPADFCAARCLLGELQTRTGHTHDAIATFREVVDLRPDALTEVRARMGLANALRIVDRYDEALAALERAEALLAGQDRPELLAQLWTLRGNIHFPRSELEECLAAHEQALAFARRAKSPVDEARAYGGLGDARYQRGHMQTARDHYARCVEQAGAEGAAGLALSHAPMLAITQAFCGEMRQGMAGCEAAIAESRRLGDPRSELLALDTASSIAIYRGDYARVPGYGERGLMLARQLGARRFEAELMAQLGHALAEQGGGADGQVLLRQASALALEVAASYCGPWCLGIQALFTPNAERARELLAQGEALLARGCVSHNHLEFRRLAIEFSLRHGDFREARRHAAALTAYTRGEPLAWSELVVRRAEWLADRAQDPARTDLDLRRAALIADIDAADFAWLRRNL
ncbi:MAG TPA: BTAD domain-containing putative transcriptional regulator [Steroidobacteraceae bacterium]|nr:BTAD domain-containing putative transcriptional regulator [Steroidobacteraceae bacterium]